MKKLNDLEQEQVTGGIPIHPSSTENHHPKSFITPKPYIYPNVYAETGRSELRDEAIGQVNGGGDGAGQPVLPGEFVVKSASLMTAEGGKTIVRKIIELN